MIPLIDEQRHGQAALAERVLAPLKLTPPQSPPGYGFGATWMADRGLSLHALAELTPPEDYLGVQP